MNVQDLIKDLEVTLTNLYREVVEADKAQAEERYLGEAEEPAIEEVNVAETVDHIIGDVLTRLATDTSKLSTQDIINLHMFKMNWEEGPQVEDFDDEQEFHDGVPVV